MAGGNPFMPPGANPGGPVPQGPMAGAAGAGGPSGHNLIGGARVPGPGVRGTGASIMAPPPPDQPSTGQGMPGMATPPSKQGDLFADVHQGFAQARTMYKQGVQAQQVLDHLREELDQLMEMGDVVRPEDVIESAGRLVGKGIGATQLAQIMSDMPAQGGEGLASWIRMHDVTITQAEQSLMQENQMFQHRLGIEAMRSMAATHLDEKTKQAAGPASAAAPQMSMQPEPMQGNDLMAGGGGGDMTMGNGDSNA